MEKSPWWHAAILGTSAPLAVLLLVSDTSTWERWGGLGCVAVLLAGWFSIGRFAYRSPRAAVVFAVIVVVVGLGLGVRALAQIL